MHNLRKWLGVPKAISNFTVVSYVVTGFVGAFFLGVGIAGTWMQVPDAFSMGVLGFSILVLQVTIRVRWESMRTWEIFAEKLEDASKRTTKPINGRSTEFTSWRGDV